MQNNTICPNCNCLPPQLCALSNIYLQCGCDPQDANFAICNGNVACNQSFVLDRVMVNTAFLASPHVKIDFSSMICYKVQPEYGCNDGVAVELLFKLERVCNGIIQCLHTWTYLQENTGNNRQQIAVSQPFSVSLCDEPSPGCCEYRVIVSGGSFEGNFCKLNVVSPNLCALVQGCIIQP